MADLKISELPALAGALLGATDPVAVADLSASETKKVTVKDLLQHGIALIDDNSIPSSKVGITLTPGTVGTTELANKSVTAAKLADNSSAVLATGLPATGAYIGQLGVSTTDDRAYIWDGSAWVQFKAAGSVASLSYSNTTGPLDISGVRLGGDVQLSVKPKDTTGAGLFMAGPSGAGGVVSYRAISSTDLPTATATSKGAVEVNGFGLKLDGDRLEIDNQILPTTTYGVVKYNAQGLVTGGRPLSGADLPVAAMGSVGGIALGTQFSLSLNNELLHANSVTAGSAAKVQFNAQGHITAALSLTATDIPDLPASKITSGQLPADRITDRSITAIKLADYATALIQEAVPPAGVGSHPIGMIWLQESTGQVSVWNGNSWMKTGASTLFNRNLRYAGSYNPTTGLVTGVTQFGTAEGFKVNDPIPAADDKIAGVYFVASGAGSSPSVAGGVTFDAGDWLLCHGTTGGWVRIDTLNGAGGGGGGATVSNLDDLLDVTLTAPTQGDFLQLGGANQWVNVSVLDEGTWT